MTTPMTIWQTLYVIFYVSGGILLIGIILLQKGRGGGIGSAFGGGGGGTSAFGAKTGDVFTWITVVLAGVVIFTGVAGSFIMEPAKVPTAQPAITPFSPTGTPATGQPQDATGTGAVPPAAGDEPPADSNPDSEEPPP